MSHYRRAYVPGGTYFFTLVTYQRRLVFQTPERVAQLRDAMRHVRQSRPFDLQAAVILPDHLHCIMKPPERQGRVLVIDAANEIARERAYSFLKPDHQKRIADAYHAFAGQPGFCHVADLESIAANGHSLSIPLYVKRHEHFSEADKPEDQRSLREVWDDWEDDGRVFWQQMDALVETLDGLLCDNDSPNR